MAAARGVCASVCAGGAVAPLRPRALASHVGARAALQAPSTPYPTHKHNAPMDPLPLSSTALNARS